MRESRPSAPTSIAGTVVSPSFLGHYTRCGVRVGDLMLQANIDSTRDVAVGAEVAVTFPSHAALGLAESD
jgi:hypothetical protein